RTTDALAVLHVGADDWPLPIPIVREADGWRFDTAAGKEELLNRRIGRNELPRVCPVPSQHTGQARRPLLGGGGPRREPSRAVRRVRRGGGLSRARGGRGAGALPRLLLPHPDGPGTARAGRCQGV